MTPRSSITIARAQRRAVTACWLPMAAVAGLVAFASCSIAEDVTDPARRAEAAGEADPTAGEQRRREAEARQEAAQRRVGEAKRKASEARRSSEAARRHAEQLRIDEADMLARARAEADERAAERRRLEAESERADAERAVEAAKVERQALEARVTPAEREAAEQRLIEAALAADAARKAMEAAREAEADRLAEKLRLAQERAEQRARERAAGTAAVATAPPATSLPDATPLPQPPPATPSSETAPAERQASAPPPVAAEPEPHTGGSDTRANTAADPPRQRPTARESRVTVLILMQPGDRGIRRTNKTADPVLCLGTDCYISSGAGSDARRVSRWQALGTGNTLGGRAGACRNSLACVFRNVDLGGDSASLQPIDLRIMRHDRREARTIAADASCNVVDSRLACAAGIRSATYRLWVVPESIARRAGAGALEGAIRGGLPADDRS